MHPLPSPSTASKHNLYLKEPYQLGRHGRLSQPTLQENGCRILKKWGVLWYGEPGFPGIGSISTLPEADHQLCEPQFPYL